MLSSNDRAALLTLARSAIEGQLLGYDNAFLSGNHPDTLTRKGACFVTLKKRGQLRGCIGSLHADRPLVEDVHHNARSAASRDPRFPPVSAGELTELQIHLSVLNPPQAIVFRSQQDLIQQLRPDVDGVIVTDRGARATFLPAVWQSLPDPEQFLDQLKRKAGWSSDYWNTTIQFQRYTVEEFSD